MPLEQRLWRHAVLPQAYPTETIAEVALSATGLLLVTATSDELQFWNLEELLRRRRLQATRAPPDLARLFFLPSPAVRSPESN